MATAPSSASALILCQFCDFHCRSNVKLLKLTKDVHRNDAKVFYYNHCSKSYKKWDSLKKHLHRCHCGKLYLFYKWRLFYFVVFFCSTSEEQSSNAHDTIDADLTPPASPVNTVDSNDDASFPESSTWLTEVEQKWECARFLLKATEEHFLTHEGIESLCDSIQTFVEQVTDEIAMKVERKLANSQLDINTQQEIVAACTPPQDLFPGLRSRYLREQFYENKFHYVVTRIL